MMLYRYGTYYICSMPCAVVLVSNTAHSQFLLLLPFQQRIALNYVVNQLQYTLCRMLVSGIAACFVANVGFHSRTHAPCPR